MGCSCSDDFSGDLSDDRCWWIFALSTVGTFAVGLMVIIVFRVIRAFLLVCCPRTSSGGLLYDASPELVLQRGPEGFIVRDDAKGTMLAVKHFVVDLLSLGRTSGKILAVTTFVFSVISIITYFIDSTKVIERCISENEPTVVIDSVANVYFTIHFVMRFIAAEDRLRMWFELASLVDFFTIPPSVVTFINRRTWLGFRFMRILRLVQFSEIIQITGIIKSGSRLQLAIAGIKFCSFWLAASGLIHMIENYGDPWNYEDAQNITYGTTLYFTMVTMSTVGYGDEGAKTALGRGFMIVFIVGGLALFASYTPVIIDFVQSLSPYEGAYRKKDERPHIVVCGHVTEESIGNFLADFLHKDRPYNNTVVVFLHMEPPSPAVGALVKRLYTRVTFIRGSILQPRDLERVKLRQAAACIILANKYASDPDEEDSSNIMRVIAAKNCCKTIRVIVQLIQVESKSYLQNIPFFDSCRGDDVICITELKLGMIAQSCLCPGFSTYLANLTCMRSEPNFIIGRDQDVDGNKWKKLYERGAAYELYATELSKTFVGETYDEAVRICYEELDLVMFGVSVSDHALGRRLLLNPAGKWLYITSNTVGFFIAQDSKQLEKVKKYGLYGQEKNVKPSATVEMTNLSESETPSPFNRRTARSSMSNLWNKIVSPRHVSSKLSFETCPSQRRYFPFHVYVEQYHTVSARSYNDAILQAEECLQLCSHIVVIIFGAKDSPLLGLNYLLRPLRSHHIEIEDLKQVVFVGNSEYLRREWPCLEQFEKVGVIEGSPLDGNVLQKAALNYCDMCVILSPRPNDKQGASIEDFTLMDKESVLASLNIKGMKYNELENNPLVLHAGGPSVVGTEARKRRARERPVIDGSDIPTLTELILDTNVQYLDFEDDDDDAIELYRTTSFAAGSVIATSVIDSVMSAAYFNSEIVTVIKQIISGQTGSRRSKPLAESDVEMGKDDVERNTTADYHCYFEHMDLSSSSYSHFGEERRAYGELFLELLNNEGILCLGIFRYQNFEQQRTRCVITSPAFTFNLHCSDKIFVLHSRKIGGQEGRANEVLQFNHTVQLTPVKTVKVKEQNHPLFGSLEDVSAV
ncbi:calcium-activated potassium channel subunit alpha-1-like [Corticium candelabrum]|uniref:calcium-activated potassium channel subunit alpha-1-like n=1 Tax=Corticium candelabrum TaxID=121492 RepID=UPI002E25C1C1|nr:calcium-activated potassium channel subunit alpha-1-like [Corticium candelabrum]